jgi:RNA polymerase-binding protein DksA
MTGRARAAVKTPAKKAPAKKAPAAAARKAATVKRSAAKAPAKKAGPATRTTRPASAPVKKAPVKKAPVKKAPVKKAPVKKAPVKKASPARAKAIVPAKAVPATSKAASNGRRGSTAPAKKAAPARKAPARPAARGADWNARDLAKIRKELLAEIESMQEEYDASLAELTELQSSSADGAGDDQADAGSKTFEREQELSIAANRFDLLSQMQRAVERIDAGTYGYCERCGKPIPRARLQAFPMATLDVECKQREERR